MLPARPDLRREVQSAARRLQRAAGRRLIPEAVLFRLAAHGRQQRPRLPHVPAGIFAAVRLLSTGIARLDGPKRELAEIRILRLQPPAGRETIAHLVQVMGEWVLDLQEDVTRLSAPSPPPVGRKSPPAA